MRRSKASALDAYIDQTDLSASTSRLLMWQALKKYSLKALIALLDDPEVHVRTIAARELQIRGGSTVWRTGRRLCASRARHDKIMGLFVLGQLGTPQLPYQEKSLNLIEEIFKQGQSSFVTEQALYSVGHLRKGRPLKNLKLLQRIKDLKVGGNPSVAAAKAFALRN